MFRCFNYELISLQIGYPFHASTPMLVSFSASHYHDGDSDDDIKLLKIRSFFRLLVHVINIIHSEI